MQIKVIGEVLKLQLFELSDEVYEKFKSNEEIRKSLLIPPFIKNNKKFEFKGESMKSFPDFSYEDKEGCKEIFNILTVGWPTVIIGSSGATPEPDQEEEIKHTIEGKKYLLLERQCMCGSEDDSEFPGYIGLIETPEENDEKIKENLSTKLTKHVISYQDFDHYQISYKNKNFEDFCFAYDHGCNASLFIEDWEGRIRDEWHPDWRH